MSYDVTDALASVLTSYEYSRGELYGRLVGLTDDEYWWEPVPGCWTVTPTDDGWAASNDPEADPAPFTTIAWRLWHIFDCVESYSDRAFGTRATRACRGTASSAAAIEARHPRPPSPSTTSVGELEAVMGPRCRRPDRTTPSAPSPIGTTHRPLPPRPPRGQQHTGPRWPCCAISGSTARPTSSRRRAGDGGSGVGSQRLRRPQPRSVDEEVVLGLPTDDETGVAVATEHHGRPEDLVVVRAHRVAVGPGHRGGQHVADHHVGSGPGRRGPAGHRTRSACRRCGPTGHGRRSDRSGQERLVARAVEHRARVVAHAPVDRDVGPDAGAGP